ncbi:hypothetical protein M0R45_007057 [Rubus argutus]|uniref:Uncharacterized protein n=1 Tax=Rubus argutus TaxID=59490 RepID=A0AAW1YT69_RUBAR
MLCFLGEGLKKHDKEKPVTLSVCLILILYWFLENTKAKMCIEGRETATPTFTKWSIQRIFDIEKFKFIPNIAEQWIKKGPWKNTKEKGKSNELDADCIDLDDDEKETPSFSEWVSQAMQETKEEADFDYAEVVEIMEKLEQGSLKATVDQNQQDIQNDSVTDEEICKIVQQIEEFLKKGKENEAEKVQSPDVHIIERHVKTMKRDIKGTTKDDTFIYNTPEELKKKEKRKVQSRTNNHTTSSQMVWTAQRKLGKI